MEQDKTFSDDPLEIVRFLVRINGLDRAREIAMEGTTSANQEGNFYRLSIWREVKHVLRNWIETPEDIPEETPEENSASTVYAAAKFTLANFLSINEVTYETQPLQKHLTTVDIVKQAIKFTVFVECWG